MAGHRFVLDDDIFEDLVQSVAEMDVAVGVGRPIVKNERGLSLVGFKNPKIGALALPFFNLLGFVLRQVGAHGKVGFGQIQSCLVVHKLCDSVRIRAETPRYL